MYPWEKPDARPHIKKRETVMQLHGLCGPRRDLPKRAPALDFLPGHQVPESYFGAVIMTHFGASNGRLSVLLSSLPENLPVTVSSDSTDPHEIAADQEVCEWHGARFAHCTPWGGRAINAIHAMACQSHRRVLFLNDDVWLFPEVAQEALTWYTRYTDKGMPVASVAIPGWETYKEHPQWGFSSWQECLDKPQKFMDVPANPGFRVGLRVNPFGACFLINRDAYEAIGPFTDKFWAEDDVWNHQVWTSGEWLNVSYPGRGYMHLGAQSWHHGEAEEYIGTFQAATGLTPDDSGALQYEHLRKWEVQFAKEIRELAEQYGSV